MHFDEGEEGVDGRTEVERVRMGDAVRRRRRLHLEISQRTLWRMMTIIIVVVEVFAATAIPGEAAKSGGGAYTTIISAETPGHAGGGSNVSTG